MNVKTILSLDDFSMSEVRSFAAAIKSNCFQFIVEQPSVHVCPKDIHAFQLTKDYYAGMLDDPDGHFLCFLVCFKGEDDQQLRFPMGIYGVSPKHRIKFPVLLSGRILNFLNINMDVFVKFIYRDTPPEDEKNLKWQRFYQVKKHLIKRILMFFTQTDDGYDAAMAWKSRGKVSMTRQVCEKLPGYMRVEESEEETEYYFKNTMNAQQIHYLLECYSRRDYIGGPEVLKEKKGEQEVPESLKLLLSSFITQLVTTQCSLL